MENDKNVLFNNDASTVNNNENQFPELVDDDRGGLGIPILQIIIKNIWIIILVTVIIGLAGTLISYNRVKTTYTARCSVVLAVTTNEEGITNLATDLSLSKLYLPTITNVIKSQIVNDEANRIYYEKYQTKSVSRGAIGVVSNAASLIFTISYSDTSYSGANNKLRAVIEATQNILREHGKEYINCSACNMEPTQRSYVTSSSHQITTYILLSFIFGAIVIILFVVLRYLFDNKIKNDKELETISGVSVLAYIDKVKEWEEQ